MIHLHLICMYNKAIYTTKHIPTLALIMQANSLTLSLLNNNSHEFYKT